MIWEEKMDIEKLRRELERFAEQKKLSYSKMAKAMNIGASTLSEFRNGTYKGDINSLAEKVESFLSRHKKKMRRIDFTAETDIVQKVNWLMGVIQKFVASNVIEGLTESAKIGYIYGRPGIGKTHAIQNWLKNYGGRGVLVTAESGITIAGMIKKMAVALKIPPVGTTQQLKDRIKEEIRFTETIIVIDEGEHLDNKVIDNIRSIGDVTGVGIVIVGTNTLKSKVYSQRQGYEYLSSRAVANLSLSEPTLDDVEKIVLGFLKNDVELYTDKELQERVGYLYNASRASIRQISTLLTLASDLANSFVDEKIQLEYIKRAAVVLAI